MLEFSIRTQGLENVLNTSKPTDLEWNLKTYRNEKVCLTKIDIPN